MLQNYFIYWYRLDSKDRYLIWYHVPDADKDEAGVVLNAAGKIPVFLTANSLLRYAETQGLVVQDEEPLLLNLDIVAKWLKTKRPRSMDCETFLDAWNLFADVSRSLDSDFDANPDFTRHIYSKIFWGANIPAITPPGKCYVPIWSGCEIKIIRSIMTKGLSICRHSVRLQPRLLEK